ncbi:MAG: cache domain-containing protein [Acidobacteriaceae bacterium]|nr:cache domain-containing protein [Acidobacteriaceae bacterium]
MDRLEIRVSITKVLLVLVIVIVPLSIVGLVLTSRSDRSLDSAIGNDFKALAQTYSNDVSEYVRDRVADVNAMAADANVIAAASHSARPGSSSPATAAETGAKTLISSSASDFLRQRRNLDPRFLNIVATDDSGAVVAATQGTTKPSYADDEVWQGAYNKGQGSVKISDILDDEIAKANYVNIAVPIGDPASGRLIGVLSAGVNISPLLARFQQNQIGNGARALLVNEDATVVSGPNADVFARIKSLEFDAIRDSLGSLQGQQSGWRLAHLSNGPYLVGFAGTGLKQHFNNLGWVVLVSEEEHQAAAPIRQLERFALVMVILAVFMLTLLFVYYFLHRKQQFEDIEEVVPSDESRARTASA